MIIDIKEYLLNYIGNTSWQGETRHCIYYGNDKGMFEIQIEINLLKEILSKIEKER